MITYYYRTLKDSELKIINEPRNGVWVHVEEPTEDDIKILTTQFGLDEDILEDAQDFFEVPRLERETGGTYFFTRYPYEETKEDTDSAPLMIVMGESFVLTLTLRDIPQFNKLFDGKEAVHTTQKAKLFIQLMTAVTTSYEKELVRLRRAVHRDRAKLRRIGNTEIVRFVNYEHKLNDMVAAVVPTNTWIQQLTKGNYMQLYNDDVELMEDLVVDNSQLVDSARSVLKTIQNVRNASEVILTNNLNTTIKTLTVLTIILTVPTIIASLYGMNVPLPFGESKYGFVFVLLFIMVAVSGIVMLFKKNKWL
ncbi:magnesium transporter CorA family protein [Candidatus Kaiserbacteria bacterium]|nr:magnesium transporter CorA family protein [Candidatus Kaiserbacteria bacterium]